MFEHQLSDALQRNARRNRRFAVAVAVITCASGAVLSQGGGHPPAIILLPLVLVLLSPVAIAGAVAGMRERAARSDHEFLSTAALSVNLAVAMVAGLVFAAFLMSALGHFLR